MSLVYDYLAKKNNRSNPIKENNERKLRYLMCNDYDDLHDLLQWLSILLCFLALSVELPGTEKEK